LGTPLKEGVVKCLDSMELDRMDKDQEPVEALDHVKQQMIE
jgi:hypothetical protein